MGLFATRLATAVVGLTITSTALVAQLATPAHQPLPRQSAVVPEGVELPNIVKQVTAENEPTKVSSSVVLRPSTTPKVVAMPQATARGVKVGSTWYDFQTNHSMPNRVAYFEDGPDKFVQVLWMASKNGARDAATRIPGFNDSRGSHYNYVIMTDPENPEVGIADWKKMETARGGWPSIGMFNDGTGAIGSASHQPVKFFRNGGLGDDLFFEYSTVTTPSDTAIWPRIAVDGQDNVHLIYNRDMPDGSNQLVYRRSIDGGTTWEPEVFFTGPSGVLPQGTTGTLPNGAGGDTYAISARGNVVAVAYSDSPLRTLLRKSTDYGRTWDDPTVGLRLILSGNHTFIDSTEWRVGGLDSIRLWSDTVVAPSMMHALVIDPNGRIHLATGQALTYLITSGPKVPDQFNTRRGIIYPVNSDAAYRGTGIYYWPEGDSLIYNVGIAGGTRWDGQGTIVSRRGYSGASRYPNLAMDANNNIYMVYTSVKSGDHMEMQIDTTGGPRTEPDTLITVNGLFGHVYLTHRPATSNVWSEPKDVSVEGVNSLFATMADEVANGHMYIAYSASSVPGDRVTNVETEAVEADVMVMAVPLTELNPVLSVNEERSLLAHVKVMPNPANDVATVQISSVTAGELAVSVYTIAGERLLRSTSPTTDGNWIVGIPTSALASGSYLLVVEQNGAAVTTTLNVLH
jgi:hypothetical protein